MIPDGSIVTYVGKWPLGTYAGFADYTGAVLSDIAGAGLTVRGKTGGFNFLNSALGTPFDIQLTLQVTNGVGFNTPDDIISVIRHFVYNEEGNYPIADSIPYIQDPGGQQQVTGQPITTGTAATPAAHACGDPSWGFFDDPGQYISCLSTKGLSTLGLVFIGLLIGVAFIVYAENKP